MTNRALGCLVLFAALVGASTARADITSPTTNQAFGSHRHVGANGMSVNITVTNNHSAMVDITATIGTGAADYTVTAAPAQLAGMNGMGVVTVRFDPSAAGTRPGSLVVTPSVGAALTIPLTGTGTQAQISVGDGNFGNVRTNTSGTTTVAVTNTSAGPGVLSGFSPPPVISNQTQNWFSVTGTLPAQISAMGTANLQVQCSPPANATGTATATITVASDADLPVADNTGTLTCTAVQSAAVVTPPAAFPDTPVNTASTRSLIVTNSGTGDLTYTVMGFGAPYSVTSGCVSACTVAPTASRTIDIQFLPTTINDFPRTLTVATNDPNQPMVMVNLTGRGTGASVSASASSLAFGDIDVGSTAPPQSLTLTNIGNVPLTITSAALVSGVGEYVVTPPTDFMTIPAGEVRTWTFACKPTDQGPRNGTFRVQSNSIVTATLDVALSCRGLRGVFTGPAIFNLNSVSIGETATLPLTVTNNGNTPISGITHVLTNTQQGFSVVPTGDDSLAPGASKVYMVSFAPLDLTDGGDVALTISGVWGATAQNSAMITVTLRGQAVTSDFVIEPAGALDFGSPRYDQAVTRTVCVRNNGQSRLDLASVSVMTTAPTVPGEIVVDGYSKGTGCAAGAASGPTAQLEMGTTLIFNVTWLARSRAGAMTATLTVASDVPVIGANRTLSLIGTSTQGVLEVVGGATVDFGAVDVQSAGATKRLTLRNMGDGRLDIAALAFTDATGHFTAVLPPSMSASLEPAGELNIDLSYRPVATAPVGSEETALLEYSMLGGTLGATSGSVTLRGRGIDRDISIDDTPDFTPTYRNPGTAGPVAPVTIRNPGEAPLHVTMLMVGDPSWELVDPGAQSFMVPGMGSAEIQLRFIPTLIGLNTGSLIISTDVSDELNPPYSGASVVTLRGTGLARDVMFAPGPVDVGFTGTNFPIEVEGAIVVRNMDPSQPFVISDLVITQEGREFEIVGETQNITLAPLEQRPFTVRFDPQSETKFSYSASVTLYLDQDMTPHETIPIVGRAVFVDARGGGGCSTSGGGAGGALAFVVALILGRRRKRFTATAIAAAVVAGTTVSAVADDVVLSTFDPTPETRPTGFHVQSGEVGDKGMFVAGASVSVATDPLVQDAYGEDSMTSQSVITRSTQIMIGGAVALFERWELGAHMPLYQQDGDITSSGMFGIEPVSGTARGDLVLHAKARLVRKALEGKGRASLAGGLQLTLPTATDGAFTGVKYPTARALILASLMPGAFSNRIALSGNLGAVLRATSEYANLEQRSGMVFGLGASVRALDRVWLGAELFGTFVPSGRTDNDGSTTTLSPIEWLAGVKYRPDYRITIGLAAGRGLTSAVGTPALRGVLSVSFTQGAEKLKPIHPPPPPKADPDDDADGLRASVDKCPNEPEDIDQFQDEDGCPDLDNDTDQVPDAKDKCPMEREDLDKFDDLDGCPDPDNDGDSIADSGDQCPQQAEDLDKFQDQDGCPESDNDKDGILDAQDKCPSKPEVVNGKQDDDGCPDSGESAVMVSADKLDLLEPIGFKSGSATFDKKAANLLGQVAATLRANPDIVKVRITCHVDPSKNPDKDQSLVGSPGTELEFAL